MSLDIKPLIGLDKSKEENYLHLLKANLNVLPNCIDSATFRTITGPLKQEISNVNYRLFN